MPISERGGGVTSCNPPSEGLAPCCFGVSANKSPSRREIWQQWVADGAHVVREAREIPSPTTTTAIVEAPVHPGSPEGRDTDELVAMIESAREQIAEAAETLRAVANETDDLYRATHLVAQLEALVSTGGWMALESETLDGWVKELTTGEEV